MKRTKKLKNFDKKEQMRRKEEKGITLISLVITIIVLLILAGVSIATLTGENGILTKANQAKEETEKASKKEKTDLAILEEMMNGTGTEVQQVTDEKPGELEKSETGDNIFIINSIEDLVFFAYDVTNENTYEGQTVELGTSLDFNSVKSYVDAFRTDYGQYGYDGELKTLLTSGEGFKPIGISTNEGGYEDKSFKGTFDGNGKIIKNLYINEKVEDNVNDVRIGLFGNNYGEIKNLGIESCNISGVLESNGVNTIMTGGVVACNYGKVNACYVSGNIEPKAINTAKSFAGGICGTGITMENCYNLASITGIGDESSNVVGGICGGSRISDDFSLKNCYNMGELSARKGFAYVGGIIANSNGRMDISISCCYNLGDITLSDLKNDVFCGGIVGRSPGLTLNNCHNNCRIITSELNGERNEIGLIVGYAYTGTSKKKCSASDCSSLKYGDCKAWGEFDGDLSGLLLKNTEKDMPDILNVLGENFKMGADGYPILKWQMENN